MRNKIAWIQMVSTQQTIKVCKVFLNIFLNFFKPSRNQNLQFIQSLCEEKHLKQKEKTKIIKQESESKC